MDARIVILLRPFRLECVRDTGRVPIYITALLHKLHFCFTLQTLNAPRKDTLNPSGCQKHVNDIAISYTVMVKNIGTPALLSDNAPLLPEKCCNYKCFGIHMFIYLHFVYLWKNTKI